MTGIELSPSMVDQLRLKVSADELPVVTGDMATTTVPGSFSLVYVVWNSIGNLCTQDEQVQCFRNAARHLLTANLDAATWGAELAVGEGPGWIYRVEPTGPVEGDPNLTGKRFPGNPTRSYRAREPLRVVGEDSDWEPHSPKAGNASRRTDAP